MEAVLEGREERARESDFPGVQEPLRVYLACYRVLRQIGDDRAQVILDEAFAQPQRRAATLGEEARRLYLEEVPVNRAIVDARRAQRYLW